MPFQKNGRNMKKDSSDLGANAPDRKKPKHKKRAGGADDSDSVDSRGNLRGFITYEDEGSSDESYESSSSEGDARRRPMRKAAEKAKKRIQRKLRGETTPSSDSASSKAKSPKKLKKKRGVVVESESEEEEEAETTPSETEESSEEEETPRRKRMAKSKGLSGKGFLPRRRYREEEAEETSDEESEDEETEETSEEEDDSETLGEEDTDDEDDGRAGGLIISFGAAGDEPNERMIPKRHNMKKESAEVKKFVKLMTRPQDDGGIDDQIDEFKTLTSEKQQDLLTALERKPTHGPTQQSMMFRILTMKLPTEIQSMVLSKYNSLQSMDPGTGEYFKLRSWLEKMISLPLGIYKEIPVKLSDGTETCGAFMERARKCLAEAIYGQDEAKIQILQFIASKIANPTARGLSLLLSGPPGIGKTSLIKNGIAKALSWPFQFISLGGDSDASTYVGHQLVYEGSHCGKIANSLIAAKSMSMVMLFDELDKISTTPKGEEVQNLLVHLTDPVQNGDFEDKYLAGIPLDLSKVLFTFSANDLGKVDRILMDRMVVVQLQGYSEKEKLAIAENFLLPAALRDVNLEEKVAMSKEVLEYVLKEYAREEQGVREYKRCMEAIAQKVNMLRIFNSKDLPFHIPDFQLPFVVKKQHVDLFLKKKKADMDVSVQRMYI